MALIGYARVSTDDQLLDMQVDALLKAGCDPDLLFKEKVSGTKTKRVELQAMLRALRKGDVMVVYKLDRLGRSTRELFNIMEFLESKGVEFRSLTESLDTTSAMGKMVFRMFAVFAEFERDLVSERTKAGLKAARARGRRGGRPPKLSRKQATEAFEMLNTNPNITHNQVARMFGVARATLYRTWRIYKLTDEI